MTTSKDESSQPPEAVATARTGVPPPYPFQVPPEEAAVGELVSALNRRRLYREVTLALRSGLRDAAADFSFLRTKGLRGLLGFLGNVAASDDSIRLFRHSQTIPELQGKIYGFTGFIVFRDFNTSRSSYSNRRTISTNFTRFNDDKKYQRVNKGNHVEDKLANIQQLSTVEEYQTRFELLSSQIKNWSEHRLVETFVEGLLPDLRREVKARRPITIVAAISFARWEEERLNEERHRSSRHLNKSLRSTSAIIFSSNAEESNTSISSEIFTKTLSQQEAKDIENNSVEVQASDSSVETSFKNETSIILPSKEQTTSEESSAKYIEESYINKDLFMTVNSASRKFEDCGTQKAQVVPVLFQHTLQQSKDNPSVSLDHILGAEPMKIVGPATNSEIALALRVLEGCCLLHCGSAALAHKHKAIKVLTNILSTRGTFEQGACLDALISLMLESSSNQMDFGESRAIEKIIELLKDEQGDENIRLKCGEFVLLLIGHVNRIENSPLANIYEELQQTLGEKCASLIWAAGQFGSTLGPEERQTALQIQARRVIESLDVY